MYDIPGGHSSTCLPPLYVSMLFLYYQGPCLWLSTWGNTLHSLTPAALAFVLPTQGVDPETFRLVTGL